MSTVVISTGSYSPSVYTRNQLRQAVANYCGYGGLIAALTDTELISAVDRSIDCAVSRLNSRQWKKWLALQTISLTVNTATYDLADLHKDPGRLMRVNASGARDGQLEFKELRSLLNEHPSATTSSTPSYYSLDFDQHQLVLDVPVDSAFLASYPTLHFYYFPRVSVSDSGTVLPPEFDWFLIWHARAELASYRRPDAVTIAVGMARELWQALTEEDNNTQTDWSVR